LEEALQSLLAQTERDFALVLVDDCSGDDTVARARELAAGDDRVEIHVNAERLGLLRNTNRAYLLARERFPNAEYFALGSDHDRWNALWLESLVAALDGAREAVLAYPLVTRVDRYGTQLQKPWRFETRGIRDPRVRLRRALSGMVAGDMIYGLFRADALAAAGGLYPDLVYPDRFVLARLALNGEFIQESRPLWTRYIDASPSVARQRRTLWPAAAPAAAWLPWSLTHTYAAARLYGWRTALIEWLPPTAAKQARSALLNAGYRVVGRRLGVLIRRTKRLL
jgi:glycosyltransferase involved in cell wall biosynthesis